MTANVTTSTYLKAVECYRRNADGRHEHVRARKHRHELAHEVAEVPHGHRDLHQVEGLREETQRQVGYGQVDDEDVTRSAHVRVLRDDVAHESISGCAEHDEESEGNDEHDLGARCEVAHGNHALVVLGQEPLNLLPAHKRVVVRERVDIRVIATPRGGRVRHHAAVTGQRHRVDVPAGDTRIDADTHAS